MLGFSPISATPISTLYPYGFQSSASVAESASGADSINAGFVPLASISESASGADSILSTFLPLALVAETASISALPSVAASTFNPQVSVTAAGTDTINAYWTTQSDIAETASGADTFRGLFLPLTQISEAATGADTTSAIFLPLSQISEAATGADASSVAPSTFNPTVAETSTLLDAIRASGTFFVQIAEAGLAGDFFAAAFLWNLIDNAENADWGQINTAQTAGWGVVDTAETADWQVIENYIATSDDGASSFAGAAFATTPFAAGGGGTQGGWVEIDSDTPTTWNVVRSIQ